MTRRQSYTFSPRYARPQPAGSAARWARYAPEHAVDVDAGDTGDAGDANEDEANEREEMWEPNWAPLPQVEDGREDEPLDAPRPNTLTPPTPVIAPARTELPPPANTPNYAAYPVFASQDALRYFTTQDRAHTAQMFLAGERTASDEASWYSIDPSALYVYERTPGATPLWLFAYRRALYLASVIEVQTQQMTFRELGRAGDVARGGRTYG